MIPHVGVTRAVIDFDEDDDGTDPVVTGNLFVETPDDELITGTVILYTLDRVRLAGMFAAARTGATDEDLFLALDAAALTEPDPEE